MEEAKEVYTIVQLMAYDAGIAGQSENEVRKKLLASMTEADNLPDNWTNSDGYKAWKAALEQKVEKKEAKVA